MDLDDHEQLQNDKGEIDVGAGCEPAWKRGGEEVREREKMQCASSVPARKCIDIDGKTRHESLQFLPFEVVPISFM